MKVRFAGFCVLLVLLASCGVPSNTYQIDSDLYRLVVTFPSGQALESKVAANRAFGATATDHSGNGYAMGGMMLPPEAASFPLVLSLVESKTTSGQTGITQLSFKIDLAIDQPQTLGAGPGPYTATLSRVTPGIP